MTQIRKGRRSIFRHKTHSVTGVITAEAAKEFSAARARLAKIVGWTPDRVSKADVLEYLVRGDAATRAYVRKEAATRKDLGLPA